MSETKRVSVCRARGGGKENITIASNAVLCSELSLYTGGHMSGWDGQKKCIISRQHSLPSSPTLYNVLEGCFTRLSVAWIGEF